MSREIDLSKPLSDEDRSYLEQRSRHAEIAYADAVHSGDQLSEEERTQLEQDAIAEQKGKRVPLQMDPEAVRSEADEDEDDTGEQAQVEEGDDPDDVAYVNRATIADLKEQLSARGLPVGGNKPDLQRRMLDALKQESEEARNNQ